jgi:vacuolar-type H+-ATPase subunit H
MANRPTFQPKRTLKTTNEASMARQIPKKPSKQEFEQAAKEANETLNSYKERAAKLAADFKRVMDDHTLAENKNILASGVERELIAGLAQLAIDVNNDQHEQEGMGSVSMSVMLLNHLLTTRDRLNHLEYRLEQQEKKLRALDIPTESK